MSETATTTRMKTRYREEILPALREEFQYANVMKVPGLTKIVVNMVGVALDTVKQIESQLQQRNYEGFLR